MDGKSPVVDPKGIEIINFGRIGHLNSARKLVETAVLEHMPGESHVIRRNAASGKLKPLKPSQVLTGYYLAHDQGKCLASELTPVDVKVHLAVAGTDCLEFTETLQIARAQRASAF